MKSASISSYRDIVIKKICSLSNFSKFFEILGDSEAKITSTL